MLVHLSRINPQMRRFPVRGVDPDIGDRSQGTGWTGYLQRVARSARYLGL